MLIDQGFNERDRMVASSRVWLLQSYTEDIVEFSLGDENRFGRMVDSRGSSGASLTVWLEKISRIVVDPLVTHFYNDKVVVALSRIGNAGYTVPGTEAKHE